MSLEVPTKAQPEVKIDPLPIDASVRSRYSQAR
jgi:hypothetical protein